MPDESKRRPVFRLGGHERVEREVDDELRFHLEERTKKLMAAGLPSGAAREQARRQFGDVDAVRAEVLTIDYHRERAMQRASMFEETGQDVRFALRTLRRQPAFTTVVLLILAFGIGANAAIFSLIDALLLRTLPVPRPEQLIVLGDPSRTGGMSVGDANTVLFSYPLYTDLRDRNAFVTALAATGRAGTLDVVIPDASARGTPSAEHPRARYVSTNYFTVLGIPALAGRTFSGERPDVPGIEPSIVISHGYWQRRFAGARDVIGRQITINGASVAIIGVTPPGFDGEVVGRPTDLWIPLTMQPLITPDQPFLRERSLSWLLPLGRLKPGVSLEQARAGFTQLARAQLGALGPTGGGVADVRTVDVRVSSAKRGLSALRSQYKEPILTLMVAVGLVLLIVSANVANLQLARAAVRQREMGVRMALGAGRRRLLRQLLTESVVLAGAAGVLGIIVTIWGSVFLVRVAAGGARLSPLDIRLDARVIGFTAAVALLTALLFGLAPAIRATRLELSETLRAGARGLSGGIWGAPGRRLGLGKLLVAVQVALSLALLVTTGMLVRSMARLQAVDLGLARDELLIADIDAWDHGYRGARLTALCQQLVERVSRLPGVRSVSFSENGVFSGTESSLTLQVPGFVVRAPDDTSAKFDHVGPGYFGTIGARLVRGRDFLPTDRAGAPRVTVVNETMAKFYFGTIDVLGRSIVVGDTTFQIVGVVADTKSAQVRGDADRRLYLGFLQALLEPSALRLEIRASGSDLARLVAPVRKEVAALDAAMRVDASPLPLRLDESLTQDKLVSRVITAFGSLALLLAALGLYGVMAYTTARRTGEFGLRMALGAQPGAVTRMVLGETMTVVGIGLVLGVPAAVAATRLVRNQLFGIGTLDVPSIVAAVVVLGLSALLAGFLPARRAASVGPLVALRQD
jgi:predicted permease